MNESYLGHLNDLVADLLKLPAVNESISELKQKVGSSDDAFVWSVIEPGLFSSPLPGKLRSGWIFVLKEGVSSGCHYHPNSVQHMIVVEGQGDSKVGGKAKRMIPLGSPRHSAEDIWFVIEEGVEHEFVPEGQDMVVISFHTCAADELEEVACGSGKSRLYESER